MRKDENLQGYVAFTAKAREFEQGGMDRGSAVKAAAEECIKEGILREYLEDNASEVINMLTQEWDWDKAMEINARDAERRVKALWEADVADKDAALADQKAALAEQAAEIERLRALLASQNS